MKKFISIVIILLFAMFYTTKAQDYVNTFAGATETLTISDSIFYTPAALSSRYDGAYILEVTKESGTPTTCIAQIQRSATGGALTWFRDSRGALLGVDTCNIINTYSGGVGYSKKRYWIPVDYGTVQYSRLKITSGAVACHLHVKCTFIAKKKL